MAMMKILNKQSIFFEKAFLNFRKDFLLKISKISIYKHIKLYFET